MDFSLDERISVRGFITSDPEAVQADMTMRTIPGFKRQVVDATNDAARAAYEHAKLFAPQGESGNLRAAIEFDPAVYQPGGLGGGGEWRSTVAVDGTLAPQARWLIEGTGIYKPGGFPIRPRQAKAMVFFKHGEGPRFRQVVAGQERQDEWWEGALDVARRVLEERLAALDLATGVRP